MKIRRAKISVLVQGLGNKHVHSHYYELKLNGVIVLPPPPSPTILMATI